MTSFRRVQILSAIAVCVTLILCGYLGSLKHADKESCSVYEAFFDDLKADDYYESSHIFNSTTIYFGESTLSSKHTVWTFRKQTDETEMVTNGLGMNYERNVTEEFEYDISEFFLGFISPEVKVIKGCFKGVADQPKFSNLSFEELTSKKGTEIIHKWIFSQPMFSVDGRTALLYNEVVCGGLCGGGSFALFEKKDGSWVLVGQHIIWVS